MDGEDHSNLVAAPLDENRDSRAAPSLPPELECEIFTMAYHQDPKNLTNLLTVSKRIANWIIPLIYEIIAVSNYPHINHPRLDSVQRYGHHIKHLFLSLTWENIDEETILRSCPNLSNLGIWNECISPVALFDLPLKRLAFRICPIGFTSRLKNLQEMDEEKYQRWCSNITHITWERISLFVCKSFLVTAFPHLTHFLFGCRRESACYLGPDSQEAQAIVKYMVASCKSLEVLVVSSERAAGEDLTPQSSTLFGVEFEDVRVVKMIRCFVTDWVRGARGEEDLWAVAEKTIKERRMRTGLSESL
ncbi:hypothetical protein BDN72DRAFT_850016 [Pluteus cervinus]|uniref:Uncharacterized protein n=1 Tax=Pluteus cervinus TaxID=181527 RepID=A0ACD3A5R4_9AGAR|nr:hypothetical protein BDN72DRAFT_850016 [Pluteus cervinus]